jgi:hypothetical protein
VDTWIFGISQRRLLGFQQKGERQQQFYLLFLSEIVENILVDVRRAARNNVAADAPSVGVSAGVMDPITVRSRSGFSMHITHGTITNDAFQGQCKQCQKKTRYFALTIRCAGIMDGSVFCHTELSEFRFPNHVIAVHHD